MLKEYFKYYVSLIGRPFWVLVFMSIIIAIFDSVGITILIPLLNGNGDNEISVFFRLIFGPEFVKNKANLVFFFVLLFALKGGVRYFSSVLQSRIYRRLYLKVKNNFFERILRLDYLYYSKFNSGHFTTILNNHVGKYITNFTVFISFTTGVLMLLMYTLWSLLISPKITCISICLGGIGFYLISLITYRIKSLSVESSNLEKGNGQIAIQGLYSFQYLISTGVWVKMASMFSKSTREITENQYYSQKRLGLARSLQEFFAICLFIGMFYLELEILKYSVAEIIFVGLILFRSLNQLTSIQGNLQILKSNYGPIKSVFDEFDNINENLRREGGFAVKQPINSLSIRFDSVGFRYGNDRESVLECINFEIGCNTTVAIVGKSGAGKSTLVNLLTGILEPSEGCIWLGNNKLSELDLDDYRKRLGLVSQDYVLYDTSVINNVTMFDTNVDLKNLELALKQANIFDFVKELENGFYTTIGDRGIQLSGGQKQRLVIARELYKRPELLILDEATSSLDSESELKIRQAIDSLHGKLTVLVVAHRLSTIKSADKILVISEGRIAEMGSFDYLLNLENGIFSKMVKNQSFE